MNGTLCRLTVPVSHGISDAQLCSGFIWGVFGWAFVPEVGIPWLIAMAVVGLCHLHAWENDPSREVSRVEHVLQSNAWVRVVGMVVTLVLFICLYPWDGLVEFVQAQ